MQTGTHCRNSACDSHASTTLPTFITCQLRHSLVTDRLFFLLAVFTQSSSIHSFHPNNARSTTLVLLINAHFVRFRYTIPLHNSQDALHPLPADPSVQPPRHRFTRRQPRRALHHQFSQGTLPPSHLHNAANTPSSPSPPAKSSQKAPR